MHIVNDEARSYLARTDDTYDILQISLIDTWAATAAGAFALSENSLYTTDSWHMFLDHLERRRHPQRHRYYRTMDNDGSAIAPLETYRTIGLAAQVLTDRGVDNPRDHILVYRQAVGLPGLDLATILVSPSPFSAADRAAVDEVAVATDLEPVLTPDGTDDPVLEALTEPGGPGAAFDLVDADITPPTDDRPFFFQMADLGTFFSSDITRDDHVTRPVFVLGMLAVTVVALAALCIGLPMLLARRRSGERAERRRVVPLYTYFLGIGLAFLLIEIAQLQRLSMFLGHPTYGLSVSLFSVLRVQRDRQHAHRPPGAQRQPPRAAAAAGGAAGGRGGGRVRHPGGARGVRGVDDPGAHPHRGAAARPAGARHGHAVLAGHAGRLARSTTPPRRTCGASTARRRSARRCSRS